jgi:hypothetical protein
MTTDNPEDSLQNDANHILPISSIFCPVIRLTSCGKDFPHNFLPSAVPRAYPDGVQFIFHFYLPKIYPKKFIRPKKSALQ